MNKQPFTLEKYPFVHSIQTRWMDNDVYGHVNNVIYYSFFDTAVGVFLTSKAGLDYINGSSVGLVIETSCTYFEAIAFPDTVQVGVRVAKLGNSVTRQLGNSATRQLGNSATRAYAMNWPSLKTIKPLPAPKATSFTSMSTNKPNVLYPFLNKREPH